jgi:hypothetical protein
VRHDADVPEQFTEAEANVIVSSAGFSIRVLGRTGIRYSQNGRSVWIDSEVLARPNAIAVAKASIRFWEDEIADNIRRAFEACGYEPEIHEPFDWDGIALRRPRQSD